MGVRAAIGEVASDYVSIDLPEVDWERVRQRERVIRDGRGFETGASGVWDPTFRHLPRGDKGEYRSRGSPARFRANLVTIRYLLSISYIVSWVRLTRRSGNCRSLAGKLAVLVRRLSILTFGFVRLGVGKKASCHRPGRPWSEAAYMSKSPEPQAPAKCGQRISADPGDDITRWHTPAGCVCAERRGGGMTDAWRRGGLNNSPRGLVAEARTSKNA